MYSEARSEEWHILFTGARMLLFGPVVLSLQQTWNHLEGLGFLIQQAWSGGCEFSFLIGFQMQLILLVWGITP